MQATRKRRGATNGTPYLAVRLRVQVNDCDASGAVSERSYWRFYSVAENELYRRSGIKEGEIPELFSIMLPRLSVVNRFHAPAFFDDELEVRARVIHLASRAYTLHFEAWRLSSGALCADGTTKICAVHQPWQRIVRLPHALTAALAKYAAPRTNPRTNLGRPSLNQSVNVSLSGKREAP